MPGTRATSWGVLTIYPSSRVEGRSTIIPEGLGRSTCLAVDLSSRRHMRRCLWIQETETRAEVKKVRTAQVRNPRKELLDVGVQLRDPTQEGPVPDWMEQKDPESG